jgi:hypothetical protein
MTMFLHLKKEDAQSRVATDAVSVPAANVHPTAASRNEAAAQTLNVDLSVTVVVVARSVVETASLAAETANVRARVDLVVNRERAVDASVGPAMKDVVVEMTVNDVVEVEVVEVMRVVREAVIHRIRRVEMLKGGDRTVLLVSTGGMKSHCVVRIGMTTDRWRMFFHCVQIWVALHGVEAFTIPRALKGSRAKRKIWEHWYGVVSTGDLWTVFFFPLLHSFHH